ncbi:hypothetical protein LCGC14_2265570 [marine sediment metagenome]|uniref:Uncharacterized protein n=1 Tax=marine sediment metagenome TaxID=412755 RepID=A0A0F9DKN9_9ZZZZ
MANTLRQPVEISPGVRDTGDDGSVDSNIPLAAFGRVLGTDWVSEWFSVEATEHGSEEVSIMAFVDWQGAAQIDITAEFRHRDPAVPQDPQGQEREPDALPFTEFQTTRIDPTTQEVVQDIISLLQANFLTDPGGQEIPLQVAGIAQFRLLARAPAGAPVLRVQVLSGGGWRGA